MGVLTDAAFSKFRAVFAARQPRIKPTPNQASAMTAQDGLNQLNDGMGSGNKGNPPSTNIRDSRTELWAIRTEDVVYAIETSASYGAPLPKGEIKHTNLTGGAPAHCAGELIFIKNSTIILNGASGRYGPQDKNELVAAANAFKESGYDVWLYGWDDETNFSFRFGSGITPEWVA